ncbi:MAG: hypothetical protein OXE81_09845 [Gammaproteobacteria bacterium]|nr:hypothetical protein [Gammaproteobacteria bacterium]
MQDLNGSFEAKALAWPVVDPVDGLPDLRVGDLVERHGLREVLLGSPFECLLKPALPALH